MQVTDIRVGQNLKICLNDGTVVTGEVVRAGVDHVVLDKTNIYHDWVWVYYLDIVHLEQIS